MTNEEYYTQKYRPSTSELTMALLFVDFCKNCEYCKLKEKSMQSEKSCFKLWKDMQHK